MCVGEFQFGDRAVLPRLQAGLPESLCAGPGTNLRCHRHHFDRDGGKPGGRTSQAAAESRQGSVD